MTRPFALLTEAWRWWLQEFTAMLPELPLGRLLPPRRHLLIRAAPYETELSAVKAGACQWKQSIRHPAEDASVTEIRSLLAARYQGLLDSAIALLGPEHLLPAIVHLPKAAARHLEEAVGYQMDRLSPFPPSNTLYAVRPASETAAGSEIPVEVIIAARDSVEHIQERASALGLGAVSFAIENGKGGLEWVSFAGKQRQPGKSGLGHRVFLAASAFFCITLLLAPMAGKNRALEAAAQEVARLKPQAEAAGRLRAQREKRLALLTRVLSLSRSVPPPLALLAKLSTAMDDQSFLFDFKLEGMNLTISGVSGDASSLAQKLGAIADFRSVKFVGAVTRDPQKPRDRFTLALELAPSS